MSPFWCTNKLPARLSAMLDVRFHGASATILRIKTARS